MKVMRNDPDMLEEYDFMEEYDFSKGIRGKYAKRYAEGTNLVLIDPDIANFFPDDESINEALRSLINIIKNRQKRFAEQADGH
jgi:hypothetical protein